MSRECRRGDENCNQRKPCYEAVLRNQKQIGSIPSPSSSSSCCSPSAVVQSLSHVRHFATHGPQHARLPCPSPSPRACSNSCPLSWRCHPTISSSVIPFCSCLRSFPGIRVFSNESGLCIRWPKYWMFSFSISPSNEYSGLISFKSDWFGLLAVQGTLKSLLQDHGSKSSIV